MITEDSDQSIDSSNSEFTITDAPIMQTAIDVLTKLSINNKMILKAYGETIPNAVAIANIITENMLKGNSKIDQILLDSEISVDEGMTSNIKIILLKN
uniref:DNA/RNA-binding protein AlbA n=1 Tax=uncultured marine thaumarchaeote KM3_69_B11 TaxID=1456244 RepID=A0A075HIG4_9ARCH|nr:DNA/RNA-binding protein AlbA [uncultured marine thaumarchaeote KM3_69_B11]